jgi:hypothetical protein
MSSNPSLPKRPRTPSAEKRLADIDARQLAGNRKSATAKIIAFINDYNRRAKPFKWTCAHGPLRVA